MVYFIPFDGGDESWTANVWPEILRDMDRGKGSITSHAKKWMTATLIARRMNLFFKKKYMLFLSVHISPAKL